MKECYTQYQLQEQAIRHARLVESIGLTFSLNQEDSDELSNAKLYQSAPLALAIETKLDWYIG
jgi:hypothetical protein